MHLSVYALVAILGSSAAHGAISTIELRKHRRQLDPSSLKGRHFAKRALRQVAFGDDFDTAYSVSMNIGGSPLLFQLDTGSADLWSANTECTAGTCAKGEGEKYSQSSSFQDLGVPIQFNYGTSTTATFAAGSLGTDSVDFAGFQIPNATFSSISQTNNSIVISFSGIFGTGFPVNSASVIQTFIAEVQSLQAQGNQLTDSQFAALFLDTLDEFGGIMTNLAISGQLDKPMYSMTLQRNAIIDSGNAGILTLGGLPSGIAESDITWAPVYRTPLANIVDAPFADLIGNVHTSWSVKIDGITVNGKKLATSSLIPSDIMSSVGALGLIDSGTTAMAFPSDQAQAIYQAVDYDGQTGTVLCNANLQMSITIAGKDFPINPVDWIQPLSTRSGDISERCSFLLIENDAPDNLNPLTYIFGDVFMKNLLTAFDYGGKNATSLGARVGFISTTDAQAAEALYTSIYPANGGGSPAAGFTPVLTTEAAGTGTVNVPNPINTAVTGGNARNAGSGGRNSGGSSNAATKGGATAGVILLGIMLGAFVVS